MHVPLHATVDGVLPEIVALRHELHQHPEIRFEERWTSDRVARFLDEAGVPYERGYAKGTGIVATLRGGEGRTVLLRADMDALEIQEETGLPYASTIPNRMHACGHDGHTACLCGVAKTLAQHRDSIRGTVKFVFQPAEEEAAGGRFIVEEGVLDDVDASFALHGWPTIPAGRIGLRSGWTMAGADIFKITVKGKACHGADPGAGVDPIVVAAHITTALQSVISRELNPWDTGVVTVAKIHAGSATNIIPASAVLEGTFRSLTSEVRDTIERAIRRIAEKTAEAHRAEAEVYVSETRYPPLYNNEATTAFVREIAESVLGREGVIDLPYPYMGAEDFAFYLQKTPGTFIWLGVNPNPAEPYPSLHNPRYNFSDEAIAPAVRLMSNIALRYLDSPPA
ncbi:MAG: amidohydrolase [Candidatus Hydrogenedentes bacterium]|nr:amidohydrolase [Candidatus Hydrogenedentota bacterium]